MIKIGFVDLDTSHPVEFAKCLSQTGVAELTCVYNSGFRSDGYVREFMEEFNVPKRCDSLKEMAGLVDIAFICSCNWNKHFAVAQKFLEAGIAVFVDKPFVGNIKDCISFEKKAQINPKIAGGSAFRYCSEIKQFVSSGEKNGEILTVYGTFGIDDFYYGSHVVEAISALAQSEPVSVRLMSSGEADLYSIKYENGVTGIYQLFIGKDYPLHLTVSTTNGVYVVEPEFEKLYATMLDSVLNMCKGNQDWPNIRSLTDDIKISLAARISKETGGKKIAISEISEDCVGYDGSGFEENYAAKNK